LLFKIAIEIVDLLIQSGDVPKLCERLPEGIFHQPPLISLLMVGISPVSSMISQYHPYIFPCRGSGDFSSTTVVFAAEFTDTTVAGAAGATAAGAGAPRAAVAARRALAGTQQRMLTLAKCRVLMGF